LSLYEDHIVQHGIPKHRFMSHYNSLKSWLRTME